MIKPTEREANRQTEIPYIVMSLLLSILFRVSSGRGLFPIGVIYDCGYFQMVVISVVVLFIFRRHKRGMGTQGPNGVNNVLTNFKFAE